MSYASYAFLNAARPGRTRMRVHGVHFPRPWPWRLSLIDWPTPTDMCTFDPMDWPYSACQSSSPSDSGAGTLGNLSYIETRTKGYQIEKREEKS